MAERATAGQGRYNEIRGPEEHTEVVADSSLHGNFFQQPAGDANHERPSMKHPSHHQALIHDFLAASEGLLQPTLMQGSDVIFRCMPTYFDLASQRRVIPHSNKDLPPNSYPFPGPTKSPFGISGDLQLVHFSGSGAHLKSSTPRREL